MRGEDVGQLEKLKLKLGIEKEDTSQDDLLNLYLEDAEIDILGLTRLDELNEKLKRVQIELAIVYYNRQGIEGQVGHNEGGISRTFEAGIPENLMKIIKSQRRLPR